MSYTQGDLERLFSYHPPSAREITALSDIRNSGMHLAMEILNLVPPGPDQQAALRKVREAVMTANAGIMTDAGREVKLGGTLPDQVDDSAPDIVT